MTSKGHIMEFYGLVGHLRPLRPNPGITDDRCSVTRLILAMGGVMGAHFYFQIKMSSKSIYLKKGKVANYIQHAIHIKMGTGDHLAR